MLNVLELKDVVGTVSGDDLNEVTFISDSVSEDGKPLKVTLGELFVGLDPVSGERFLLRVSNVGYGQRKEWMKESARSFNRMMTKSGFDDEHQDFSNRYQDDYREQLFIEAYCEYVGFIDEKGSFGPPKHLPPYDAPVRRLNESDLDFMSDFTGDIKYGKMRSGSNVLDVDVGLFSKLIPYHIGIFAKTGMGKSNVIQRIILGVLDNEGETGMLLLEPHGEYKNNLKKHPNAKENLIVFTQDNSARKLRISYADLKVSDLMNVKKQLHWSEPQERFLREAEEKLGQDWFRFLTEVPVTMDDATTMGIPMPPSVLKDEFGNTHEDTMRATQSKLKRVKGASFLNRDPHVSDVNEILTLLDEGKVVLIDMASLENTQELLLSTILTSRTLSKRKSTYNKDREKVKSLPPISVVLEECQRVLNREMNHDGNVFAQVANEGRKFGVGLLPITQQPKNVDVSLLSQVNTLFILGISDKRDFETLSEVSSNPIDKLRQEIRSLQPGEGIVSSTKNPFALSVKVDLFENYLEELKDKKKKAAAPPKKSFRGMV